MVGILQDAFCKNSYLEDISKIVILFFFCIIWYTIKTKNIAKEDDTYGEKARNKMDYWS